VYNRYWILKKIHLSLMQTMGSFFFVLFVNKTEQILGCIRNNQYCCSHNCLHFNGVVLERAECCTSIFICTTCISHSIHNVILLVLLVLYKEKQKRFSIQNHVGIFSKFHWKSKSLYTFT